MKQIVIKLIKGIYFILILFPKNVFYLLKDKSKYDKSQTYYPELTSKTKLRIILDQICHIIKWRCIENYYFLYGFDIKGFRKQSDYLDYSFYMKRRDELNNHPQTQEAYNYIGILRDKFYFAIFMEQMAFPIPKTIGLYENKSGLYSFEKKQIIDFKSIIKDGASYMCKPLLGLGGVGIYSIEIKDNQIFCNHIKTSLNDLKEKLSIDKFFIQERIQNQHPKIAALYPNAINTLRITTVRSLKTEEICVMGCMFLMGARNAVVSNWHYGGVIINVNEKGIMDKYGYSLYEKRITQHPDTHVKFENFHIPYFDEALQWAKKCHNLFYGIHSIGWDFAITDNGVLFIEGNDNWGMAAHQMVSGGLAKKFNQYYFK